MKLKLLALGVLIASSTFAANAESNFSLGAGGRGRDAV
jgi:outer membrane protein